MRTLLLLFLVGCTDTMGGVGGADVDAGPDDDPLIIAETPEPGSLDDLHARIVVRSCAGQPGLCHAGQFEPNLSTPALMYENLVNAPGLEIERSLRVTPGSPEASLLVDKLRHRNDVATQMPLGADPLPEAEIAEIEAWIADGALRRPGAEPAPMLNQAPLRPQIAVFDAAGERLDAAGAVVVSPGTTLTFRMSVEDFETDDADVLYALFFMQDGLGRQVYLTPGADFPNAGFASFDPDAPSGAGDELNWRFDWTVPALATFDDGSLQPTTGRSFSLIAYYVDELSSVGMPTFDFALDLVRVE